VTRGGEVALLKTSGTVAFLLVRNVGGGSDHGAVDAEVVVKLNAEPDRAMGFRLRKDADEPTRRAMLDTLWESYLNNWTVVLDYDLEPVRSNGVATLVGLTT
jgi:hypothetical protein